MLRLTFVQAFNAMRFFLSMYYEKTRTDVIGTMCGSLNLFKDKPNWRENPDTFDPAAWDDWMCGVQKTMNKMGIDLDPKKIFYDEELAFLCMKNYLQVFYDEFLWKEVDILLISIKSSENVDSDLVWQEWIKAVNHTINGTYELDVYFDPFTGKRMS